MAKQYGLILSVLLSACVIPLGKSPTVRATSTPETNALCDSISRERDAWTTATVVLGTLSGGGGIASLPAGDEVKPTLQTVSASLALAGVVTGIIAAERSQRYTRVCP